MTRRARDRWTPSCDVVSLADRRVERLLSEPENVVLVTLRLARDGHLTARDLTIDYPAGTERPDLAWLTREIHRAGVDVSECWEDAEPDGPPPADNTRPFRGRG